ncbi:MAG: methionyl-tRNA formyltransferase [Firmicutes bacterium]|nr:methionyl-tRNA formyltransferase [Bacillota bacterium]
MKIVFMGTMEFAVPILEGLKEKYEVSLVVTQPDRPFGRKQTLKYLPIKKAAIRLNIPLFQPESIKKDYKRVLEEKPDMIIVCAYGQMIPSIILEYPRYHAINVHASLLPKFRGGAPMHKAIQLGETFSGVTVMYMAKKMDSGMILSQRETAILDTDDVGTLQTKLSIMGKELLLETIPLILNNQITPIEQKESLVTFAYNIKPEEEHLNLNLSAKEIYNHVRGFHPWPLTFVMIDEYILKTHSIKIVPNPQVSKSFVPGQIIKADKSNVYINTGDGVISLEKVQLQGKKVMDISSFMNGIGKSLFIEGKILK